MLLETLMFVIGLGTGLGVGLLGGVLAMASVRLASRYDDETEAMLDGPEYAGPSASTVHDFTGGHRHRIF
jgi:hypothetical protein